MAQSGHLLACPPSDLGEHSKQEGRLEFILGHGLIPRESSHFSGYLNGDVSGRTMGQGGGKDMQLGWLRCGRSGGRPEGLGVWRLGREVVAASTPARFPSGLGEGWCC